MSNNKRTGKFYRKNEVEVMESLGLKPTKNSGSGWVEKEDGQNEYVIAQLKSTDAASIKIQQKDINILEYNASVTHKVPCFVIQFLNNNDVFVMARPEDLPQIAEYINTGKCEVRSSDLITEGFEEPHDKPKAVVRSSSKARESFWKGEEDKWKRKSKRK